jgi:hypothetical protein
MIAGMRKVVGRYTAAQWGKQFSDTSSTDISLATKTNAINLTIQ